jgi:biotin transport system substrate-specific component
MNKKTVEITIVALFPAMMAATAGIVIPLGSLPSITLQIVFVYLAGLMLPWKKALLSMSIYLLFGAIGLPVFSGFTGGLGVLFGMSGGFLLGFLVVVVWISIFNNIRISKYKYLQQFIVLLLATILLYLFGAIYITYLTKSQLNLVLYSFFVYFPGDILKIFVVIYLCKIICKHLTYEWS